MYPSFRQAEWKDRQLPNDPFHGSYPLAFQREYLRSVNTDQQF